MIFSEKVVRMELNNVAEEESYSQLKKQGLVEGRYPHIFVSYKVANIVGQQTDYVRNKGLSNEVYKKININALETREKASVTELKQILLGALPVVLDDKQQLTKVANILQAIKREKIADVEGTGHVARWYLKK